MTALSVYTETNPRKRLAMMDDQQCVNVGKSSADADCQRKMDSTTPLRQTGSILEQCIRSSDLKGETFSKSAVFAAEESSSATNSGSNLLSREKVSASSLFKGNSATANSAVSDLDTQDLAHDGATSRRNIHFNQSKTMTCSNDALPPTTMGDPITLTTMEIDICDTRAPQRQPLHAEVTWVNEMPEILHENSVMMRENSDPKQMSSPPPRPRLTLSAFRRPENTVRIADMDPSRKISTEYDFSTSRILGHGASSTVRLAVRRRDGVQVAVKTIAKHEALRFRRMRHGARRHLDEWELLRSLKDNPHVVSLLDVFETDDEIQLVMEYCQGGELFDVIQEKRIQALDSPDKVYRYSERKAARIVSQMLSVLAELHSRGIVHRDVKPENILLTNDLQVCAKLSDFGTSRELHPEVESDSCSSDGEASPLTPQSRKRAYSAVGSNFYAAPEVRSGEGYDTAVDLYSLGVTLYVLLCGFPPSFSTNQEDDVVSFPRSCDLSDDVKRLIRKMLDQDASRRITAREALQDVWIVRQTRSSPVCVPATRTILSPSAPRPVVDMELVRSRLFKDLDSSSDEDQGDERGFKRRKVKGDFCLSMADLMDGVASAAASAEAAAAGVFDDDDSICVVEDVDGVERDDRVTSPFEASFTALSV